MNAATTTFFWHDYETFGVNPRRDRPAQFAGIRTDADLNEVGDPVMIYCRPSDDYLPEPEACLVTGITPQLCLERGLPEHVFAERISAELGAPGTIGVGYNTIRFDDEVTRFLFWRNLMDPYAREWQNGCGRWDLLDVVRCVYALRPEGIQWPLNQEGRQSFRLEHLTAANGLAHEAAHDALSDVRATIALARLIRQKQPKLFDFCLALRRKDRVLQELGLPTTPDRARPFLHVSGMVPPERGCLAVMWPLAMHPSNRNELLAWDLSADPSVLAELDVAGLRERLFTRSEDLPEGVQRLPIKGIHVNKSPIVVRNLRTLSTEQAARWGIDMDHCLENAAKAQALPDLSALWADVFQREKSGEIPDVDEDLYGGFLDDEDRRRLERLRTLSPEDLAAAAPAFNDERLTELVFRYRARNYPETLTPDEHAQWEHHRVARLLEGRGGALTVEALFERIDQLSEQYAESEDAHAERAEEVLGALYDYASEIAPSA